MNEQREKDLRVIKPVDRRPAHEHSSVDVAVVHFARMRNAANASATIERGD
jgi:hypothetical protein